MRRNISILLSLLAFIAVLTLLLDYKIMPDSKTLNEISEQAHTTLYQAPDFTVTDIKGRKTSLNDLKGKIVILHFWATWCAPCVKEFPKLMVTAADFKHDIVVLALSSDDRPQAIDKFLKTSHAKSDNVYVVWDQNRAITHDLYQTFAYPETIIIGSDGKMLRKISGDADWSSPDMKSYLSSLVTPLQAAP